MASDAQITQSQIYWRSATPIAIVETGARAGSWNSVTYPYLLLRNTGMYPIRITGIIGGDGGKITQYLADYCGLTGLQNLSDYYYLAPGEEKYIAVSSWYGLPCNRYVYSSDGVSTSKGWVGGASSVCQNSTSSPGVLDYKTFGFEYIQYMEGQQITKRQIGKDLIIKCREPA